MILTYFLLLSTQSEITKVPLSMPFPCSVYAPPLMQSFGLECMQWLRTWGNTGDFFLTSVGPYHLTWIHTHGCQSHLLMQQTYTWVNFFLQQILCTQWYHTTSLKCYTLHEAQYFIKLPFWIISGLTNYSFHKVTCLTTVWPHCAYLVSQLMQEENSFYYLLILVFYN